MRRSLALRGFSNLYSYVETSYAASAARLRLRSVSSRWRCSVFRAAIREPGAFFMKSDIA